MDKEAEKKGLKKKKAELLQEIDAGARRAGASELSDAELQMAGSDCRDRD